MPLWLELLLGAAFLALWYWVVHRPKHYLRGTRLDGRTRLGRIIGIHTPGLNDEPPQNRDGKPER